MLLCGVSSVKLCYTSDDIILYFFVEVESSPIRCLVFEVRDATCGADFSVIAGLPQYGQLGHGADNECLIPLYFLSFRFRLGHKEQKDEQVPCRVEIFTKHNVLPPDALIASGSVNSACTAGIGQLYMWGKVKNKGGKWLYPKPVMDSRVISRCFFFQLLGRRERIVNKLNLPPFGKPLYLSFWCMFFVYYPLVLVALQVIGDMPVLKEFTKTTKICENTEELKTKLNEVLHEKSDAFNSENTEDDKICENKEELKTNLKEVLHEKSDAINSANTEEDKIVHAIRVWAGRHEFSDKTSLRVATLSIHPPNRRSHQLSLRLGKIENADEILIKLASVRLQRILWHLQGLPRAGSYSGVRKNTSHHLDWPAGTLNQWDLLAVKSIQWQTDPSTETI
ncbi:hypothetical protein RHMOL_Rhmol03G0110800 [Rhododendron molle]|uniref:Uncharacterized protein n=1 Tax=Rhododendron molle TaxID=49168 RepID=A0ACC0PE31_RHOML|nr:hypothetical protein RHMOL_Rhmol03G0110800 [Rhododendron molle]